MERYKVLKTIGDGSFGTVFKAIQKSTGELVAIKRIKRKFETWEECLELREIKTLRKLVHPCIIKLKEVVRQEEDLNLIFEFVDKNIVQVMQDQGHAFSEQEIKVIVFDILQGLAYMHKNGFFHRDVKPDNVLMTGGRCKIIDFGLAKEIRSRPPHTEYVSTRWYRAPEVLLHSQNYTWAIDIFAVGCVMAELYIMRPIFPGSSELDQLTKLSSVLGTPNEMDWPGGLRLAEQRGYAFPQYVSTPLNVILPMASQGALGVLGDLLQWNPSRRPTAEDALKNPFFGECALESPHHSIFPDGDHIESTEEMIRNQRSNTSINRQSPSPRVTQGTRPKAATPVPGGKVGTQAKGKSSVFAGVVGKQPTALTQIGLGRHRF